MNWLEPLWSVRRVTSTGTASHSLIWLSTTEVVQSFQNRRKRSESADPPEMAQGWGLLMGSALARHWDDVLTGCHISSEPNSD